MITLTRCHRPDLDVVPGHVSLRDRDATALEHLAVHHEPAGSRSDLANLLGAREIEVEVAGLCGGDVTPAMIEEVIAGPGPCREVSLADSSSTSALFSEMTKRQ